MGFEVTPGLHRVPDIVNSSSNGGFDEPLTDTR